MEDKRLDVIYSRKSVRSFTGAAVSRDDLLKILRAGMSAPSAVNVQPWAFVVVTKKEMLEALCDVLPYAKMLDMAGAAIVVCGIPEKDNLYSKKYWTLDCSAASENILLACHALGLGAVWTAAYPEADRMASVRKLLDIPEKIMPLNVIPIGVPADKGEPKDKFLHGNIHWEQW